MTDTPAPAEAGSDAARRGYRAEQVADPLTGCVDLNAVQEALAAAEEQPELPSAPATTRKPRV